MVTCNFSVAVEVVVVVTANLATTSFSVPVTESAPATGVVTEPVCPVKKFEAA